MINPIIKKYEPLVDLLADLFGSNCEVVLHDIKNPERSIVKIRNGHITSRKRGGPITDLGLKIIKDNKNVEWVFLLTDIAVRPFYPEYMLEHIRRDREENTIKKDTAIKHLDYLEKVYYDFHEKKKKGK